MKPIMTYEEFINEDPTIKSGFSSVKNMKESIDEGKKEEAMKDFQSAIDKVITSKDPEVEMSKIYIEYAKKYPKYEDSFGEYIETAKKK